MNADEYALVGGKVWDSATGQLQSGLAVHVRGGQIVAVCPPEQIGPDVQALDVTGHAVMPGLIDAHVHSEDWQAPLYLANGVTTVRDTGCALDEILDRRARWQAAGVPAPRLVCCGPLIDGPGDSWPAMSVIVRDPAAAQGAVDRLINAGVDQIKLYASLDRPCFAAALERAHDRGRRVVAHLQEHADAREAIAMGVDEIEHLSGCAEALWPERRGQAHWRTFWPDLEPTRVGALVDLIVSSGVRMTVTLAVWHTIGTAWDPRHDDHPQMAYVPQPLRAWWTQQYPRAMPCELRVEWRAAFAGMQIFTSHLIRHGARIIAGSDAPFVHLMPGFSLHTELQHLLDCGMCPAQAIAAATCDAAEALGIADMTGGIEAGKRADLLVVAGDPLADIRILQRPVAVIRDGRWYAPETLLAQAAVYAATASQRVSQRFSELY